MRRISFSEIALSVALVTMGDVRVQSEEKSTSDPPTTLTEDVSVPLMTAQVVSVKGVAKLSYVRGTCFLVRDETASRPPAEGEVLHDGDLLDLSDDCTIKIKGATGPELVLQRSNGRFFKVHITK